MADPFAPRTIELTETPASTPGTTPLENTTTPTTPPAPEEPKPFTAPPVPPAGELPSIPEPAGGPSGSGGRFSFLKGKLAKIILALLIILIPVSVYVVYNYTTIFKPRAIVACVDDSDCPPGYVCENGVCVLPPPGCQTDANCTPPEVCDNGTCIIPEHKECQDIACVLVVGRGSDQCSSDPNCQDSYCQNNSCVIVPGSGNIGCTSDAGCQAATHKECQNNACVDVSGAGGDNCTSNPDCAAITCVPQGGSCSTSTQCCVGLVCSSNTCLPPPGGCGISAAASGTTQCAKGGTAEVNITLTNTCGTAGTVRYQKAEASCASATSSQSGCTTCGVQLGPEQSITVAGNSSETITASAGVPRCGVAQVDIKITSGTTNYVGQEFGAAYWDNSGCGVTPPPPSPVPPPPTPPPQPPPPVPQVYRICENQACVSKTGSGSNLCNTNADCQTLTHKECINQACRVVSGGGINLCDNDTQCQVPTHKECRGNSCVVITGPGKDQCTDNKSCGGVAVTPPAAPPPAVPQSGSILPSIVGAGVGLILTILGVAALLF